ncbi:MAG: 16S rRNA (guanine(527)-N(7))-methyltransferase RsmG [Clostridia bacterium]|nr:16S rRNA (guanine(527)-N(7))-methyltransferase RsmG [Clostridia bacterium]
MIDKELLKNGASSLGIDLSEEQLEQFDIYAENLVYWNERINLTAITDPEGIVKKHFIDSLALLKYCDIKSGAKMIDVGTGAGFPGLVIKIARPDVEITLMDSTQKKLSVIEDILGKLELDANIIHARAEEAGHDENLRESFDFATARAVSNLRDLTEYCLPFVTIGGSFISLKGADAKEEAKTAEHAIEVLGGKIANFDEYELDGCGERAIIKISKVSKTPANYPRPKGKMQKQPL